MIGAQRGLDVHVLDHHDRGWQKRAIVSELGGTFHLGTLGETRHLEPDVLMECTGAPIVVRDALGRTASGGIVCLIGVSAPGHALDVDVGGINRTMVLDNDTVFGTVNANRKHYEDAVATLQRADRTLAEPADHAPRAGRTVDAMRSNQQPDDIKVVVDFT